MTTPPPPPATIRRAALIGIAEGIIGLVYAIIAVIHQITHSVDDTVTTTQPGRDAVIGYGNAAFILIVFGFVGFCGWLLWRGNRFGRGPVIILQMLLIPVAYYMWEGGQPLAAIPTALVACYCLYCCFNKQALEWATAAFRQ